jgi:uncharacterized protein
MSTDQLSGFIEQRMAFRRLPVGAVRPAGWLREQLQLQADGLTGHLEELWPDVGPDSAWLGGSGEDWERGPYYADGLVPLAHVLRDKALVQKARRWTDAIIQSQRQDGQFGPTTNADWWPRMVALKVLAQHYEASHDDRVLPFMERYFKYQQAELPRHPLDDWAKARAGENLLVLAWYLRRRPSAEGGAVGALLTEQALDWEGCLADNPPRGFTRSWDPYRHVVNVAMGLKLPAVRYLFDGDAAHLRRLRRALRNLEQHHGQVTGMFSGDEWLAGRGPSRGVELCAVAEFMFTLETLAEITGAGQYGDRLEEVTYNAFAATLTADMRAHQYLQQPNQVACTIAPRPWTCSTDDANIFGLEPHFGCCAANLHQGWPKFVTSLWMAAPAGGLAGLAYAPCRVESAGRVLEVETGYPFSEEVAVRLRLKAPDRFPLHLRVPAWCEAPQLAVRGDIQNMSPGKSGFVTLEREWHDGDVIELNLKSRPRVVGTSVNAVGLKLGPLLLALPVGEDWRRLPERPGFGDWEVYPTTPWNYGLAVEDHDTLSHYRVVRSAVPSPPFGTPALRVDVDGRRVDNWKLSRNSAGRIPSQPQVSSSTVERVGLVPYGSARLRVAEFPRLRSTMDKPVGAKMGRRT